MMSFTKTLRSSVDNSTNGIPDEETCGFEIGCGSYQTKRFPVFCFQRFATARWALLVFGLGAVIQGFIVNGNIPAVISTLEKRFELSSTEAGLITSCYDIAGSATILFVTYVGGHGHKPLWIGWGMFLVGLSGIAFSLPHFVAPYYTFTEEVNLCGNAAIETCTISSLKDFRFLFYGAMLLCGVGASPLYSLVITYLDENVKQRYSSLYNGAFIAMSIFGPGIGFLAGAAFLSIYTYPDENVNITESNEQWVGAWWIGFLIAGGIGILISIGILMYPKVIPGTEKHRMEREKEIHVTAVETDKDPVFGRRFKDFPKVTLQLFRNPTFVFETLGITFDSLIIGGMATFGPKYLETQFGVEPSNAGIYFGLMAIVGGVGGQLIGGAIISKFNMNVRWMLHICYIAPLLTLFCSTVYLLTCSSTVLAGVTTSYHNSTTGTQLMSQCNALCQCSAAIFSPVCGVDGASYFSPCFAGCQETVVGGFTNCTCVGATVNGAPFNPTDPHSVTSGACPDMTCSSGWMFALFCVFNFLIMFLTFFNEAAALQVSLRCVSFKRRSFAIGVQVLVWRVLGTIPGPLVVGAIFDSACQKWTQECGTRGSCIFYDNHRLSLYIFLFIAVSKFVDMLMFVAGLLAYKPVSDALPPVESFSDEEAEGSTHVTPINGSVTPTSGIALPNNKVSPVKTLVGYPHNGSDLPGKLLTRETNEVQNGVYLNGAFKHEE